VLLWQLGCVRWYIWDSGHASSFCVICSSASSVRGHLRLLHGVLHATIVCTETQTQPLL
jgi:hypothetical protein